MVVCLSQRVHQRREQLDCDAQKAWIRRESPADASSDGGKGQGVSDAGQYFVGNEVADTGRQGERYGCVQWLLGCWRVRVERTRAGSERLDVSPGHLARVVCAAGGRRLLLPLQRAWRAASRP
jgi:hypothetical protein